MSKIEKFIDDFQFNKNLIFVWNPWVWKTHIMKKLFERLPKNEWILNKFWMDDWEFREKITSWMMFLRKNEDYKSSILKYPLEMCVRVKILFFDDLGASENVSEAQKTKLKYILDEREKKGLITIFSTNLSPKEIQELYGKRIKSRIYNWKHKKWLSLITIPWEDKRKENIEQITL